MVVREKAAEATDEVGEEKAGRGDGDGDGGDGCGIGGGGARWRGWDGRRWRRRRRKAGVCGMRRRLWRWRRGGWQRGRSPCPRTGGGEMGGAAAAVVVVGFRGGATALAVGTVPEEEVTVALEVAMRVMR